MATYTDNFSTYGSSDGNLPTVSSNVWIDVDFGLYYIAASNYVRARVGSAHNNSAYNQTFTDDQYAECKIVGGTANNNTSWAGPAVRINTTNGAAYVLGYISQGASSFLRIFHYGGSGVSAQSTTYGLGAALAASDVIRLEASGTTLTAKLNGATVLTWTDSSLTSGKAGLHVYAWAANTDFYLDDWGGGDLGGSSAVINTVSDETPNNGQTGITIGGTGFGASQGTGNVYISPTDNVEDSSAVIQTVTSWGDTSITITAVQKHLGVNAPLYLFVKTGGGLSNESGHSVMFKQLGPITPRTYARAQAATVSGTGDVTP